jgi:hypothetical protein
VEIPRHGALTQPDMPRHGGDGPAVAVQGPDLLICGLPACLALGGAWLGRCGRVWGWHGHRDAPIGQRHWLLAQRLVDGGDGRIIRGEHLVADSPEMPMYQRQTVHEGRLRFVIPRRHWHWNMAALAQPQCQHGHDGEQGKQDGVVRAIARSDQ